MKNTKKTTIWLLSLILAICVLCVCLYQTESVLYTSAYSRKLPIYSVETDQKLVSITFDCAWGVDYTDKLLEEMERFDVKCTFFAVQFWVEKYPEYVKKIVSSGHEMGTHSATHSHMAKLSADDIACELTSSTLAIETLTGQKVTLFRAPFGEYNDTVITTANSLSLSVIQWDVDSLDWKDLSAQDIALRVISRVKNGSIILCHNNGLHTAEALPLIFADLTAKGYKFVPVSQLIYKENYYIDNNGRQHADA